jgi:hypothetical protein
MWTLELEKGLKEIVANVAIKVGRANLRREARSVVDARNLLQVFPFLYCLNPETTVPL